MTTSPAPTKPVQVNDVIRTEDGKYVVVRVRENGRLVKARHAATNTVWHLVRRNLGPSVSRASHLTW